MSTTLLIDVSSLAHRALHTTGGLSFEGSPTGVLFGVLRDIESFVDKFVASRCVFAFDSGGGGHRQKMYPDYKSSRKSKDLTEDEQRILADYRYQIMRLEREILPDMGYKNIYGERGFEADDILAYVAERIPSNEDAIIITSDNDLLQCLRTNVSWYSPTKKKLTTAREFKELFGIEPIMWANVKAIAGCSTDDVPGINGVGETIALKFVKGQLKRESKAYDKIMDGLDIINRNMKLVTLPFDSNPPLQLRDLRSDEHTQQKRMKMLSTLGIRSKAKERSSREGVRGFF